MKKEQWISLLLGLFFVYSLYRWSTSFYSMFTRESFHFSFQLWINFSVFIAGVVALVQFYTSGFLRSQFLRAYLIYMLASVPINLIFTLSMFPFNESDNFLFVRLGILLGELIVTIIALDMLKDRRTPQVSATRNEEGEVTSHYIPSELHKRFFNRVLDVALLIYIVYTYHDWWSYVIQSKLDRIPFAFLLNNPIVIVVLESLFLLTYYIIMEYFFRTTFGKVITGTTIVHARGGYPSLGAIIGRSFCRLLPADAISFFFSDEKRGWHDKFSNTGVVEDQYVNDAG